MGGFTALPRSTEPPRVSHLFGFAGRAPSIETMALLVKAFSRPANLQAYTCGCVPWRAWNRHCPVSFWKTAHSVASRIHHPAAPIVETTTLSRRSGFDPARSNRGDATCQRATGACQVKPTGGWRWLVNAWLHAAASNRQGATWLSVQKARSAVPRARLLQ